MTKGGKYKCVYVFRDRLIIPTKRASQKVSNYLVDYTSQVDLPHPHVEKILNVKAILNNAKQNSKKCSIF